MVGMNTVRFCMAEIKRLLELALKTEGYVQGNFKIKDVRINRDNRFFPESIEIDIEGFENS